MKGNKQEIIIDEDFRMKVVNFLKIYGYYDGELVKIGTDKKYVSGKLKLSDVIQSKQDFKELKRSINRVLEYCYRNGYDKIECVIDKFYNEECADIRNLYGGFFDKH